MGSSRRENRYFSHVLGRHPELSSQFIWSRPVEVYSVFARRSSTQIMVSRNSISRSLSLALNTCSAISDHPWMKSQPSPLNSVHPSVTNHSDPLRLTTENATCSTIITRFLSIRREDIANHEEEAWWTRPHPHSKAFYLGSFIDATAMIR